MPIANILRLGTGALTNQQIADLALEADRLSRAAIRRGDVDDAHAARTERDQLCEQLR